MHKLNKIKIGKLFFCFLLFLFILYVLFHSRTYEVNYTLEDVSVTEKYDKKEQVYRFILKRNDQEFFTLFEHKYFHSKKEKRMTPYVLFQKVKNFPLFHYVKKMANGLVIRS